MIFQKNKNDYLDLFIQCLPWFFLIIISILFIFQSYQFKVYKNNIMVTIQKDMDQKIDKKIHSLNEEYIKIINLYKKEIETLKEEKNKLKKEYDNKFGILEKYSNILMRKKNTLSVDDIMILEKYAKDSDMPDIHPYLVFAMQYVESKFNSDAVNKDCIGIGQIKLSTAKYIKKYYGYNDLITEDTLKNNSLNIKYHVSYLKLLYKTKKRNWYNVIMVYSGALSTDNPNKYMWEYISRLNNYLRPVYGLTFNDLISNDNFVLESVRLRE